MEQVKEFLRRIFYDYKCYVTFFLVIINVLVYGYMFLEYGTMDFDVLDMHEMGAMIPDYADREEWYRLVTAIFLHFDPRHIGSNMLMLAVVGSTIERMMGSVNFALVYLLGGVVGNVFSAHMHALNEELVISAGASGAVFAISGALVWVFLIHREETSIQRIGAFVVLLLYQCFAQEGVDHYAHLGGLVSGFVLTMILLTIRNSIRRKERNGY